MLMDSFDMMYSACMIVPQGSRLTRLNLRRLLRYGLTNTFRKFKSVQTLATYAEQLALPGKLTVLVEHVCFVDVSNT